MFETLTRSANTIWEGPYGFKIATDFISMISNRLEQIIWHEAAYVLFACKIVMDNEG